MSSTDRLIAALLAFALLSYYGYQIGECIGAGDATGRDRRIDVVGRCYVEHMPDTRIWVPVGAFS
jgi:hypothetical protein